MQKLFHPTWRCGRFVYLRAACRIGFRAGTAPPPAQALAELRADVQGRADIGLSHRRHRR